MMKGLTIGGILIGAMLVALMPVAHTLYRQAYPADRARDRALASCTQADPDFDRLDAVARAACYQRFLTLPAERAVPPAHGLAARGSILPG